MTNQTAEEYLKDKITRDGKAQIDDFNFKESCQFTGAEVLEYCKEALSLKEQETEARILREVIKLGDKWEIAEESPIKSGEFEYVLFKESALFKELTSKIKEEKESEEK